MNWVWEQFHILTVDFVIFKLFSLFILKVSLKKICIFVMLCRCNSYINVWGGIMAFSCHFSPITNEHHNYILHICEMFPLIQDAIFFSILLILNLKNKIWNISHFSPEKLRFSKLSLFLIFDHVLPKNIQIEHTKSNKPKRL